MFGNPTNSIHLYVWTFRAITPVGAMSFKPFEFASKKVGDKMKQFEICWLFNRQERVGDQSRRMESSTKDWRAQAA